MADWLANIQCRIQGSAAAPTDGYTTTAAVNAADNAQQAARRAAALRTFTAINTATTAAAYTGLTSKTIKMM